MITRIGIVGDQPATVLGLTAILNVNPSLQVVATAPTAWELASAGDRLDVVILDLHLEDSTTPRQNLRVLSATGAAVLVFATGDAHARLSEAAHAGAVGLIRKSEPPASVVRAVHAAARGEELTIADWSRAAGGHKAKCARLTKREAEVLMHYAAGGSADEVGKALYVTRETVHDHIRRIRVKYAKVGRAAPTKVDLFRRAIEDGLVDSSGQPITLAKEH